MKEYWDSTDWGVQKDEEQKRKSEPSEFGCMIVDRSSC